MDQAIALFGAEHAYVQPHSGADANLVAFWAVLNARIEDSGARRTRREGFGRIVGGRMGNGPAAARESDGCWAWICGRAAT